MLCIGPAGENLVRYAVVGNDKNRVYGRCGAGAVWGSKNLKAIRVRGREKTALFDKERFQSGYDQAFYLLRQAPVTKRLMRELGTAGLVELINVIDMLPHRNFQDCTHDEAQLDRVSGETIAKTILERAAGCFLCPIGCQRHTRIEGPDGKVQRGEGPEYETVVLMGPDCDVYDLAAVTTANYRCNELGLDTISFGGTVACAMELNEKGLLPAALEGSGAARFGNAAAMEELAIATAHRRGLGDWLAEGSYRLAERCGRPDLSMTVKKLEIPAYDPRASFTQALGYMTSPSGRLPPARRLRRLAGLLRRDQGDSPLQPAAVAHRHPQHAEPRHPAGQPGHLPLHRLRLRQRSLGADAVGGDGPGLLGGQAGADREPGGRPGADVQPRGRSHGGR